MGIAGILLAAALTDPGFDLKTWSTGDGLPSDAVIALAQTPDRYLWIANDRTRAAMIALKRGLIRPT
jgi:hypothetical protein